MGEGDGKEMSQTPEPSTSSPGNASLRSGNGPTGIGYKNVTFSLVVAGAGPDGVDGKYARGTTIRQIVNAPSKQTDKARNGKRRCNDGFRWQMLVNRTVCLK